jgi:hypothetical protein
MTPLGPKLDKESEKTSAFFIINFSKKAKILLKNSPK